ncbi:MAG: hypothetical protein HN675_11230 [Opitutae bacterium]|nr:hypothetical protein [Opitutae bacterium]MBT7853884.1 hypothetical protein [Opitutae bacterium]
MDQSKTQYQSIFLDYLTASLSNVGLQLITPEDQVKGITTLRQNPSSTNGANTLAEQFLSDNGMKQLADTLKADLILKATITQFDTTQNRVAEFERTVYTHNLTVTYRFAHTSSGGSFKGGLLPVSEQVIVPDGSQIGRDESNVMNGLLIKATAKITDDVMKSGISQAQYRPPSQNTPQIPALPAQPGVLDQLPAIPPIPGAAAPPPVAPIRQAIPPGHVQIYVVAKLQGLWIPEIVRDENNNYTVSGKTFEVYITDADVQVDGISVGTTSPHNPIPVKSGLHRIRIARTGFVSQERFINPSNGQLLTYVLQPSPKEYELWRSQMQFLAGIKRDATLTDAQVKVMHGLFNFLSNSKFEIPDITVNQYKKSLF